MDLTILKVSRDKRSTIERPFGFNEEAKRKAEPYAYYFNEEKLTVKEICQRRFYLKKFKD